MHNRCPRELPLPRKPMPDHRWPLHKLIPNAGSVALPVVRLPLLLLLLGPPTLLLLLGPLVARLPALFPVGPLPIPLPVGPPTPINGLPLRAPKSAAICASRMSTPCAVMGSWSRVRNKRRSTLRANCRNTVLTGRVAFAGPVLVAQDAKAAT